MPGDEQEKICLLRNQKYGKWWHMKDNRKRNLHKFEEIFPDEFYAELKRCPLIYLASGGIESHGPHNALGTDGITGYEVALRAAEISGGIVFPPVFLGDFCIPWEELKTTAKEMYKPSVWHSRDLMMKFFEETIWNFERLGFRLCVNVPGHAGNWLQIEQYLKEKGDKIGNMALRNYRLWDSSFAFDFTRAELDHGGIWESSLVESLRPGFCSRERLDIKLDEVFPKDVKMQWTPENLSAEKISGKRVAEYLERAVRKIAAEASEHLNKLTKVPSGNEQIG